MHLQIDRSATIVDASGDRSAARGHFDRHHWIRIPQLLSAAMRRDVRRALAAATFVEVRHTGVNPPSVDVCMEPNALSAMLELLCNDPVLLRAIEALTGAAPLVRFSGFVYRLTPAAGHHHNWHNDVVHERRVAMSINLEAEPYDGGVLQIRERESGRIIEEVTNTGAGDAILFRIDPALQQRATAVTRGTKTAFAGWFRSAAPLRAALAEGRV